MEPLRWTVDIDSSFVVTETICPAVDVGPEDRRAREFLRSSKVVGGCRELVLDLGRAADALSDRNTAQRAGADVVVSSPDFWLWRPRPARSGRLAVTLPEGFSAVLPFPQAAGGGFDVDASTWAFISAAVFGRVRSRDLVVAGSTFQVVLLPGELKMVSSDVDRWLTAAAESVASANHGQFPFKTVVVVVDPVWGRGVPFGMVSRGGGPQVLLLLGAEAVVGDVVDDWVAVHEFSHLLMPPVGVDDAWLTEGLASYYQNILRARIGLLTQRQAWEGLRDGFQSGADAAKRGPFTVSLKGASARMHQEGRYLQVYWGGAAVILMLDVELRRCAGLSVDDLVASFRAEQQRVDVTRIRAQDFVARAAGLAPACAPLQGLVAAALGRPFPETDSVLRDLGVGSSALSDTQTLSALRRQIDGSSSLP